MHAPRRNEKVVEKGFFLESSFDFLVFDHIPLGLIQ